MINLNKFKRGYFILWGNEGGVVGDNIEKEQLKRGYSARDSKFVHIDVSGGRELSVRVNPPKTKVVDIRKEYPGRSYLVVAYKNYNDYARRDVAFWASSNCNLKYDFLGVLKFKIPFLWHKSKLFFCSENALWALQKEYPEALNALNPHNCMPADFLNENFFEVVHGGRVPKN